MRRAVWNGDGEQRAFVHRALHLDLTAMHLYQLIRQRQANAAAFMRAAPGMFNATKTFEQFGQLFRGNTRARIANGNLGVVAGVSDAYFNAPSKVDLSALESRFRMTFSHISRSR